MTANLIDLSSLIVLLGGKKNLKPFELQCDCSHCHVTTEGSQQRFTGQGLLKQHGVPGRRGEWGPALLAQPDLEVLHGAGESPVRISSG